MSWAKIPPTTIPVLLVDEPPDHVVYPQRLLGSHSSLIPVIAICS